MEPNARPNFDKDTGKKLRERCNCWVLGKLYSCEHDECPGLKLHAMLAREKKSAKSKEF